MSSFAPIIGSMTERWVGVGRSADTDSATAGAQARAAALDGRADARLLIVFASPAHDFAGAAAPGSRPATCRSSAARPPARSPRAGPGDHGVVVLALGGPGFSVCTAVATGASARLREAGAEVARCLDTLEPRPHRTLLLLSDGLAGDQQEIVRGAYDVAGAAVPLVGGCAGDDLAMRETFVLHGDQVLRDAVVGVALGSRRAARDRRPARLAPGRRARARHPQRRQPRLHARRPARAGRLPRAPRRARRGGRPAAFTRFALSHPLGLGRRSGEDHVRFVGEADFEDRSLGCIAAVPQGAIAWFMEGDAESVLAATDDACARARWRRSDGATPLGVLAFDCIARRSVLGDDGIAREVARIGDACGGAPVAGFYTYGEIARTRGISGFHNQTLVVLAVG